MRIVTHLSIKKKFYWTEIEGYTPEVSLIRVNRHKVELDLIKLGICGFSLFERLCVLQYLRAQGFGSYSERDQDLFI